MRKFDRISKSATVLMRSFSGVLLFRKKPQPATQPPAKNEPAMSPKVQSKDGGKKKTMETAMNINTRAQKQTTCHSLCFYKQPAQQQPDKNSRDSAEDHTGRIKHICVGK
jgi:hypothetical protein